MVKVEDVVWEGGYGGKWWKFKDGDGGRVYWGEVEGFGDGGLVECLKMGDLGKWKEEVGRVGGEGLLKRWDVWKEREGGGVG